MALPYPYPTSEVTTRIMRANRKVGTRPELLLRSALHRRGLRFRKELAVDVGDIRVRPDVTFPRRRVAAFLDGCFWHRCPTHATAPASNSSYWIPKLQRNVERDRRVDAALGSAGWTVIRVWEHDLNADIDLVASRIQAAVVSA